MNLRRGLPDHAYFWPNEHLVYSTTALRHLTDTVPGVFVAIGPVLPSSALPFSSIVPVLPKLHSRVVWYQRFV